MKNLVLAFLLCSFFSCRPDAPKSSYNTLTGVPLDADKLFETDEEVPVQVKYVLSPSSYSVDLELIVLSSPKHGTLSECIKTKLSYTCTYTPDKDFFGEDSFEVTSKDGSFTSKETSRVIIKVRDTNDIPVIGADQTESLLKDTNITFHVNKAFDSDTPAGLLDYNVVTSPKNGKLSNCLMGVGTLSCTYTPNNSFIGDDFFTYQVIDDHGAKSLTTAKVTLKVAGSQFEGEEKFIQATGAPLKGVDIVWVIDNSGSMGDEQENLALNFNAFIDNFLVAGKPRFDFNMQVTVSDAYKDNAHGLGSFVKDANGNHYDFSSASSQSNFSKFKSDFKSAVKVGTKGSGSERTLSSMDANYTHNASWFRGNDYLLVYIIVTDEKEQSINSSAAQWAQRFQSIKDKSSKVRIYSIIDPSRDSDNRYAEIVRLTASKIYNIKSDFSNVLDDISLAVSNLLKRFLLKTNITILESSLKVYVNNVEIPRLDASGKKNWEYDSNAIEFTNNPAPNSQIRVTYTYFN